MGIVKRGRIEQRDILEKCSHATVKLSPQQQQPKLQRPTLRRGQQKANYAIGICSIAFELRCSVPFLNNRTVGGGMQEVESRTHANLKIC
jgi:hypothetical protein